MNRESIIIIICISIVVLFYLFQENTMPVDQVNLMKESTRKSSDNITKEEPKQVLKEVNITTPDSLNNQENQGSKPK
jgi:hypothetical protein